MRVADETLKAVVFLGTDAGGSFVPYGTALVSNYLFEGDTNFGFFVTASHVIDQLPGTDIVVRFNTLEGQLSTLRVPKNNAIRHPDPGADIAIIGYQHDEKMEYRTVRLGRDMLEKERAVWNRDLGDEVFTVGLYTTHYGETKNQPVVRVGTIAMMPGEKVLTSAGYSEAYLVEVRSLAGLSGSPVFCNAPIVKVEEGQLRTLNGPSYSLIGIMLGYHLVASAEDQIRDPEEQASVEDRNTGLAVVSPIERALEILELPGVVATMKATKARQSISGTSPAM